MARKVYYLASGFFNEDQVKVVEKYENLEDTHNVCILSPRKRQSAQFNLKLEDPMRDVFLQEIFQQNVSDLDASSHLLINLSKPYDIGALWELGYFLAWNGPSATLTSDITVIDGNPRDVSHWIRYVVDNIPHNTGECEDIQLYHVTDFESFKDVYVKMEINYNAHVSVCIDDRDRDCMIALGYLYQRFGSNRISTYSTQNHGSNVMIACSIANHYKKKPELSDIDFTLSKWEMNKVTE